MCDDGYFVYEQYDTVCQRCGFVFNGKIPEQEFIDDYYRKTTIRVGSDYNLGRRLCLLEEFFRPNNKLIEYGSGRGEFLGALRQRGYDTCGIEAGSHLEQESTQRFDGALAYYVLEHSPEPVEFLKQMRNSLKPQGIIVIEVPNFITHTEHSLYLEHLNHFTPQHLFSLLTRLDFSILKCDEPHSRQFGFAVVARKGMSMRHEKIYHETMKRIKEYWSMKHG